MTHQSLFAFLSCSQCCPNTSQYHSALFNPFQSLLNSNIPRDLDQFRIIPAAYVSHIRYFSVLRSIVSHNYKTMESSVPVSVTKPHSNRLIAIYLLAGAVLGRLSALPKITPSLNFAPTVTRANKIGPTVISIRIMKAVFGDLTDPMIQSLNELAEAQPSLRKSVESLQSQINEFALRALETMSSHLDINATTILLKEPEPDTVTIIKASYGPTSGASGQHVATRADVKWILVPLIHNSVLRIPKAYPLVHLFGTKPKGEDGGGENYLDVEAYTTAGPFNVSIEVKDGKLVSELYISSAKGSKELFISAQDLNEVLISIATGKRGVEIGGPSYEFEGLYKIANSTDVVNFAENTLWGTFPEGSTFNYKQGGTGTVHITDGSTLDGIDDSSYDFALGSHYLEHLNNPLKALATLKRVLKTGGHVVLILPRKEACFDSPRGLSRLEEFIVRYLRDVSESDMRYSNSESWILGNDLRRDRGAGTFEQLQARTLRFPFNKAIHTMVYDLDLLENLAKTLSFEVVRMGVSQHHWIVMKKIR